ncbi:hypothetical protein Q8A73_012829 [Channa argus]|nr:hypothetical protein Q8A73_012829 [Channa argus]
MGCLRTTGNNIKTEDYAQLYAILDSFCPHINTSVLFLGDRGGKQKTMSFLTCSRPEPSSKMGSCAVAVSSSVCIFPLTAPCFLPSSEPGAGSSHPGNVRRQEPPRRSSQLGHPIRCRSGSNFTMAGPAAKKHRPLQILQPPLWLFSRSEFVLYPLHPSLLLGRACVSKSGQSQIPSPPHPPSERNRLTLLPPPPPVMLGLRVHV